MGFSDILNSLLDEASKKVEMKQKIEQEIQQLKSKSNQELQKIAHGWEPEARRRAAQIILNHRNQ